MELRSASSALPHEPGVAGPEAGDIYASDTSGGRVRSLYMAGNDR